VSHVGEVLAVADHGTERDEQHLWQGVQHASDQRGSGSVAKSSLSRRTSCSSA
jgi:hypothetical protein